MICTNPRDHDEFLMAADNEEEKILNLAERLEQSDEDEDLFDIFLGWTIDRGFELYPAQEEAILEIFADNHVILNTPTGSGKSMVALAMHFYSFAMGKRSYYTSPIKALVSEKFFSLCEHFGAENVGMLTGDASINHDALIICCTQEILSARALSEGADAPVDHAIIDEFHYYADRERGTAWQLPLLLLPQTCFLLMSATLGDTANLRKELEERTDRPVALVQSSTRPVPLTFEYSFEKTVHLVEKLVREKLAPVYIVNFTQRECAELAQSLVSVNYCTKEEKEALKVALHGFSFDTPYGKTISKYLRHGIAIHHGGLLPKYRLLTEKLAQRGLLKAIVGTDTLGVGINLPLRTVVFTKLCKYDGSKVRLLKVREFKQIAGRAGRKGYDSQGLVICQAPEHVIENKLLAKKHEGNPKKLKKLKLKAPPERGFVHWDEETYRHLTTSDSEELTSRFRVDHSMLVSLLQRPTDGERGYATLLELIELSHEREGKKQLLRDKSQMLLDSLTQAGIVEIVDPEAGEDPPRVRLAKELQQDFSIHHSLSLFVVDVMSKLNPEHEEFHLTVISFVEAILEDPNVVLIKQRDKARKEAYNQMKAEGLDYNERQEKLETITYPQPGRDTIFQAFELFVQEYPWVAGFEPSPKSIVRDMYEHYFTFNQYVKEYGLERSEGVLLRHLNQTYKALRQNVPEQFKTREVHDVIAYLREVIARADSSLIEEWRELRDGPIESLDLLDEVEEEPLDADVVAFKARIRAELRQIVAAIAEDNLEEAAALVRRSKSGPVWGPMDIEDALEPFYAQYERVIFNHAARSPKLIQIERTSPGVWEITQILLDDAEDNMWFLRGSVDLNEIKNPEGRLFALSHIGN